MGRTFTHAPRSTESCATLVGRFGCVSEEEENVATTLLFAHFHFVVHEHFSHNQWITFFFLSLSPALASSSGVARILARNQIKMSSSKKRQERQKREEAEEKWCGATSCPFFA